MKKIIGLVALLLFVGAVSYVYTSRVEKVEEMLSASLGMDVELGDVRVGWNRVTLDDLKVTDFENKPLFSVHQIEVGVPFWTLLRKEIVIESLALREPKVSLEVVPVAMERAFPREEGHVHHKSVSHHKPEVEKHVSIDRLSIEGLTIDSEQINDIKVPYFEIVNLKDATSKEICEKVFSKIMNRLPKTVVRKEGEDLKATFNEGVNILKRKTEEAKEFLEELFAN